MAGNKTPIKWDDDHVREWSNPFEDDDDESKFVSKKKSGGGGSKVKAVATAGLDKAKTAAVVSANKVKFGTSVGFKWVKSQYQKKCSSKSK